MSSKKTIAIALSIIIAISITGFVAFLTIPSEKRPGSNVVEVNASSWTAGTFGSIHSYTYNGVQVKVWNDPPTMASTGKIIVNETILETRIGHALYLTNGTPIIFKAINAFYGDAYGNKFYTGIGFLFKYLDGNWYIRTLSYAEPSIAESRWSYVLSVIRGMASPV